MQWRNSKDRFGWLAMSLHWVMAVMVPGLAAVGLWMTSLNYYSPWYTSAPFWHKSVGLVFAALLLVRLLVLGRLSRRKSGRKHKTLTRRRGLEQ